METEVVAWGGLLLAAFSTFLAAVSVSWQVYTHRTDRGKLKVQASLVGVEHDDAMTPTGTEIWCSVTNVGRQPLFVTEIGVQHEKGARSWAGGEVGIPTRLSPGEWHPVQFTYNPEQWGFVKSAWARDSLDRKYWLSRKEARSLMKSSISKMTSTEEA